MSDTRKLLPREPSEEMADAGINVTPTAAACIWRRMWDAAPVAVPEFYEWQHGCDAVCNNVTLWLFKCPHCGKPRPPSPAPSPDAMPPTGLEPPGCPTPGACSCPAPDAAAAPKFDEGIPLPKGGFAGIVEKIKGATPSSRGSATPRCDKLLLVNADEYYSTLRIEQLAALARQLERELTSERERREAASKTTERR